MNQKRLDSLQHDPPCVGCGKQLHGDFFGPWPACSQRCMMVARWKRAKAAGNEPEMRRIEEMMGANDDG